MMTAEQLRASILQLAMQGKLVEQRPEEGSGEELYFEILRDKQRLISQGKIKKEQGQANNTDEPPFDIPESWKWAKLNDIITKTIKRGKSPKYSAHSNTLVFAQKCNTKAGTIDISLCQFLNEDIISKYPADEFMIDEDIVINSTGNGTLGRVGIYRDSDNPDKVPIVPDSHVTIIRSNRFMNVGYVYYCLKYYQPYMERLGTGSTNQTELGAGVLKELDFPIPPLAEQERIVAKIEELMPFVEQYAKTSAKLKDLNTSFPEMLKNSILQEAIQGKLVPQDPSDEPASILLEQIAKEKQRLIKEGKIKKQIELPEIAEGEIPFDIPESWEWVKLGEVATVLGGKRIPAGRKLTVNNTGHIYIRVSDMKDSTVLTGNLLYVPNDIYPSISQYIIHKEDVYITVAGTIGAIGVIPEELDGANLTENADRLVFTRINQKWFVRCLQSPVVQNQIANVTTKVGQPKLAIKRIQNLYIPLPPLAEQKRIVARIEELLSFVEKLA